MDKIGVVLSGGGARGSFQVGALEVVIKEIGLKR
jgi:predicted acylesterase/phospholipase RssA